MSSWLYYWYRRPYLYWPLMPLSWVFASVVCLRRWLYLQGVFKTVSVSCPVIVVGNLEVSGSGKTPFVIALVNALKQAGFKPGIVSRGYGRSKHATMEVLADSHYADVGDEALLIHRQSSCPVFVGRSRLNAARSLLQHHDCNVIVCDDGLQHYALKADLTIALEYVHPEYRNHGLLPVGPYREPRSRFEAMDFHVQHGAGINDVTYHMGKPVAIPGGQMVDWHEINHKPCYALAGIAKAERFYDALRKKGLSIVPVHLSDHATVSKSQMGHVPDNAWIIMTEKDLVKYPNHKEDFGNRRVLCVPYSAMICQKLLAEILIQAIGAQDEVSESD